MFSSKDVARQKMVQIFECVERLYTLMEIIETEFEPKSQLVKSMSESLPFSSLDTPKREQMQSQTSGSRASDSKFETKQALKNEKKVSTPSNRTGPVNKFEIVNLYKCLTKMK